MEINTIALTRMHNNTHFEFGLQTILQINEFGAGPSAMNIQAQFDTYKTAHQKEDDAFKKIKKSEISDRIAKLDKDRDSMTSYLFSSIRNAQKHYSDEVVNAAKRLMVVVNTYKKLTGLTYINQTSETRNMLQELKSDKYKNDVALVRVRDLIDQVEILNNQFAELMNERIEESAAKNHDDLKQVRLEVDKAYNAIIKSIDVGVIVNGAQKYEAFIIRHNILIDQYKTMMATSGKRKKDGE